MRIIKSKLLLVLIALLALPSFSWSQELGVEVTQEWTLLLDQDGIKFYGRTEKCSFTGEKLPSDYAFLKIENSNRKESKVNYQFALEYLEGCAGCEGNSENTFIAVVPGKSSIEANCDFSNDSLFKIIYNPNRKGGWHYESMKILNLLID